MHLFLIVSVLTGFSGCAYKAKQPSAPISWVFECEPTIVAIDRVQVVNVPVGCKTPNTFCSGEGSLKAGTIEELLQCVYILRESNKRCR